MLNSVSARLPVARPLADGWRLFYRSLPVLLWPLWAANLADAVPGAWAEGGLLSEGFSRGDLLLTLVSWCVQSVLYGYSIARLDARAAGEPAAAGQFWSRALRAAPAVLIGDLVYNIAAWGGLLVFVVPGIIFGTTLVFFAYAAVIDRKNVFEALSYSHALAWPEWWRTSVVLSAPAIALLVYGVIMAWPAIVNAAHALAAGELPAAASMLNPKWYDLGLMPLLGVVVWAYVLSVLYVQYGVLKARAAAH